MASPRPESHHFRAAAAIITSVPIVAVLGIWLLDTLSGPGPTVRLLPVNQWSFAIREYPCGGVTGMAFYRTTVGPLEIFTSRP